MDDVYFKKIKAIEKILNQVELKNLVLVFTKKDVDRFLLVYNDRSLPRNPSPNTVKIHSLDHPEPADYLEYDGPALGFPELDIIAGCSFYTIEHLFQKNDRLEEMHETAFQLARHLYKKFRELTQVEQEEYREHWFSRIIRLGLLKLLGIKPGLIPDDLAALLPNPDFDLFLGDQPDSLQMLSIHELSHWKEKTLPPGQWVAAFEEAGLFNEQLDNTNPRFLELRTVFRRAGLKEKMKENILNLAIYCRQEGERSGNIALKNAAYALGAEAWLAEEDIEDLVALLPHENFEVFIREGRAMRIYRSLLLHHPDLFDKIGPRVSISELLESKTLPNEIPREYRTSPVSFPILSPFLQRLAPGPVIDMGPVLQKAGHEIKLASIFLLLSRDLLKSPSTGWLSINAGADAITNLALRATTLFNFIDPGLPQWRKGRHSQFLEQSYLHLEECLVNEEKRLTGNPLAYYYRVLKEWYGSFIGQDLPRSLGQVIQASRDFLEKTSGKTGLESKNQTVEQLQRISAGLLYLQPGSLSREERGGDTLPRTFEIGEYIKDAADSTVSLEVFSSSFEILMHGYDHLHSQWMGFQDHFQDQRQLFENLNQLHNDYKRLVQAARAPAHELKILQWACREDMQRIRRRLDNLEVGPVIQVRLLNPQLVLDSVEWLHLEVENTGGANAYNFVLELVSSRQMELHSLPAAFKIETFAPIHHQRVRWQVKPLELASKLNVIYKFNDREGNPHSGEESIPVNVVTPKEVQRSPGKNVLYQAGIPVSGPKNFFGRARELSQILRRLLGGSIQPILLRSPRRMGKSSILRQLKWLITERSQLQQQLGFSPEEEIQLSAIQPVLSSLQELKAGADYSARWFQKIFMAAASELGVEYEEKSLDPLFDRDPTQEFRTQMSRLFKKRPQSRLLIMVDEWDTLRHPRYSNLAENLRAIMELEERINWIVTSTWTLSQESSRFGSPFYNQAFAIELKELDWKDATDLVIVPGDKMGVTWQGDAVVTLLELTGQRPYLTQFLCSQMMDYLYEHSQNRVDSQAVIQGANRLVKETLTIGSVFGFLWGGVPAAANDGKENEGPDEARLHWLGQFILWVLDRHFPQVITRGQIKKEIEDTFKAHGLTFPGSTFFNQEFDEQMLQLQFVFDVIAREGDRYNFGIPLARQWFHQVVSQQSDPVQQAHQGIWQDWEEWKKKTGEKSDG